MFLFLLFSRLNISSSFSCLLGHLVKEDEICLRLPVFEKAMATLGNHSKLTNGLLVQSSLQRLTSSSLLNNYWDPVFLEEGKYIFFLLQSFGIFPPIKDNSSSAVFLGIFHPRTLKAFKLAKCFFISSLLSRTLSCSFPMYASKITFF